MKPFLRFFLAGLFLIPVSCLLFSGCSSLNFLYKDAEKYSHGNTELTEKVENLDLSWVSLVSGRHDSAHPFSEIGYIPFSALGKGPDAHTSQGFCGKKCGNFSRLRRL